MNHLAERGNRDSSITPQVFNGDDDPRSQLCIAPMHGYVIPALARLDVSSALFSVHVRELRVGGPCSLGASPDYERSAAFDNGEIDLSGIECRWDFTPLFFS